MHTFKTEIDNEITIPIKKFSEWSWMSDKKVTKKKEPVRIPIVMKYVNNLLQNTFPKENPIFSQMISSGYGALSTFKSRIFPFFPLILSILWSLQHVK